MKHLKVLMVAAMLGLSVGLLPKVSMAHDVDVGVGFFFGLPIPILTFADDGPGYHHGYDSGPYDYRPQGHYSGYYNGGGRYQGYRHGYYGRGDYGRGGHGRGDYGRGGHGGGNYGNGGQGHGGYGRGNR